MNKKGAFNIDVLLVLVLIFTLSIGCFIIFGLVQDLNTAAQDLDINADAKAKINQAATDFPTWADGVVAMLFTGLVIGLFVTAWKIETQRIAFVIVIIVMAIIIYISMLLNNAFLDLYGEGTEGLSIAQEFVFIPFLMENLVTIITVLGFATSILLYAKSRQEEDG